MNVMGEFVGVKGEMDVGNNRVEEKVEDREGRMGKEMQEGMKKGYE